MSKKKKNSVKKFCHQKNFPKKIQKLNFHFKKHPKGLQQNPSKRSANIEQLQKVKASKIFNKTFKKNPYNTTATTIDLKIEFFETKLNHFFKKKT